MSQGPTNNHTTATITVSRTQLKIRPTTQSTHSRPYSTTPILQLRVLNHTKSTKQYTQTQKKIAAANKRRAGRSKDRLKINGPPQNEELVRILRSRNPPSRNEPLMVRLVTEHERDSPPEVNVVTLDEAVATSKKLRFDLIGVSVDQKPPVIKCVDYNRMIFDMQKQKRESNNGADTNKALPLKEFRFKAGMDDADFERKAGNMLEYLIKGHLCQASIFARLRHLRQDKDLLTKTAQQICDMAEEHVSQIPKVSSNGTQRAVIKLNPKKKKN